ncbi:MAG: sodium:solute symporter, partial [Candidatus Ornithospirochaeta sp.]
MMYFGLISILVLILLTSVLSSTRQKGKDYSGRHSASAPLVLGGIVGTIVGGSSTVGTAQAAFNSGFSAWWYTLGCSIGILIFAFFFSRRIYNSDSNTLLEIVSERYGEKCGEAMSLLSAGGTTLSIVAQVLSGVALMTAILGVESNIALLIFALLVLSYVFFGGGISLGYMGILKAVLMAIGFGACGIVALYGMGSSFFSLPSEPYFNMFSGGVWKNMSQVISLVFGIITGQNYTSALITGKTYRESKRAIVVSSLIGPAVGLFCILTGLYMKLNYPEIDPSTALPLFIVLKMPSFVSGCLLGMLLLTLVGTTSGTLFATSTIIYRGLLKKRISNETRATRGLILFFLALVSFIVISNKGDLILTWTFLGAGLRGAVSLFPLMLSLFVRKTIRRRHVLSSMIAAPACTVLGRVLLPSVDVLPIFWGILGSLFFIILGFIDKKEDNAIVIR